MKHRKRKPCCIIARGSVKVPVYKRKQRKGKKRYTYYQVPRHEDGERHIEHFATLEEAKAKATEIAEVTAQGDPELIAYSALKRPLQNALEALEPTGLRIDHACRLVADACQIIASDKILEACRLYKRLEPDKPFTPTRVKDGATAYLAIPKKIGWRRKKTLRSNYNVFERRFGEQWMHEVNAVEFRDFVDSMPWTPKTYNEFLRSISLLYREGQFRSWVPARCNPTEGIKRQHEPAPDVGILEPAECRNLLNRLAVTAPELVAGIAIWAFSGIRLEEIGRLDWPQVNLALKTGKFAMQGSQTKKKKQRSVPVMENLRVWLTRFNGHHGPILPQRWLTATKSSENRLNELPRYIRRKTGCVWRDNWGRHSFGTYYFVKCKDPGKVVKAMGNNLKDFERNYWSKVDAVTEETAAEWFSIMPPGEANIIPMPNQEQAPATTLRA